MTITIIKDIEPFKSPVDGTMITSRSDLREHNIRNNVRQVGNDFNHIVEKWKEEGKTK